MMPAQTRIWPGAVRSLRDVLAGATFPLDVPKRDQAERLRDDLVHQLNDYLIPRLVNLQAPVLVCVGGSTGAGKSTLVNSLVRSSVCEAGVLRPTSRSVVVVHHPNDTEWWQSGQVLPDIERVTVPSNDPRQMQLVATTDCPEGIALVDTPDLDSVDEENAEIATQMLAAADAWLFVTTPSRYADAIPWDYLLEARRREVSLAIVLNRVPPAGLTEISEHLRRMMSDQGLGRVSQFTIEQGELSRLGLIPKAYLGDIESWLQSRQLQSSSAIATTLLGTLDNILDRAEYVAAHADGQNSAIRELEGVLDSCRQDQLRAFATQLTEGSILRGECLDCWQDFAETAAFFRAVSGAGLSLTSGWLPAPEIRYLVEATLDALTVVLIEHIEQSRSAMLRGWQARPFGWQICRDCDVDLEMSEVDSTARLRATVTDWWNELVVSVRVATNGRLRGRRWWSIGVNGVAAAALIVILGSGDSQNRRGPGTMAYRLVEAALGEAGDEVIDQAGARLGAAIREALGVEQERFRAALRAVGVDLELGDRIRDAVEAVDQ